MTQKRLLKSRHPPLSVELLLEAGRHAHKQRLDLIERRHRVRLPQVAGFRRVVVDIVCAGARERGRVSQPVRAGVDGRVVGRTRLQMSKLIQ